MLELLATICAWQREGHDVALATLVAVSGSAPRDPGVAFAVCSDGRLAGSISGGCVESALFEEAQEVLRAKRARAVEYGLSDDDAQAVGLTCGGRLRLLVEPLDAGFCARVEAGRDRVLALVLRLDAGGIGARMAVFADAIVGTLGNTKLDDAAATEVRDGSAIVEPHLRTYGEAGEPHGNVEVYVERIAAPPEMYVFGAIDFAAAMVRVGNLLGYHVSVCDARPAFATLQRFPHAARVIVQWPDEFLKSAPIDERTAIIALTHDEKFDIPLLAAAIRSRAGYVGAMGSRATHERRLQRLRDDGVAEIELARLSAPIGLDIGARTPEETALAIGAEIVAQRNGRPGGRLTGGAGTLRGRPPIAQPSW